MKIIELRILSRVEIALKDNKSGQTHVESYPEIDAGLLRADQWDEDYTVTVTSSESHSSQELIVAELET